MTKDAWVLGLGLSTALLPFLGFPQSWRRVLFFIIGLAIAGLAFLIRRELVAQRALRGNGDSFSETGTAAGASYETGENR